MVETAHHVAAFYFFNWLSIDECSCRKALIEGDQIGWWQSIEPLNERWNTAYLRRCRKVHARISRHHAVVDAFQLEGFGYLPYQLAAMTQEPYALLPLGCVVEHTSANGRLAPARG